MAGDLDRFKSTLVYEAQAPADRVAAVVQDIRQFDSQSEGKIKTYKKVVLASAIGLILGIVLTATLGRPEPLALVAIGGLGAIVGGVLWRLCGKYDFANRRYELLEELVRLLNRDMPKDAEFKVKLDLAQPAVARKKTGTGEAGVWKVTYYVDPWLLLEGRFADGTAFQIEMVEKFQARGKWKRSRSGKNKYKTKTKSATQCSVRLRPKQKRYENLAQVADQTASFLRLPGWVAVKKLDATADELSLTVATTADWSAGRKAPYSAVEMAAKMLLSLYQVLHASHDVARS